MKRSSETLLLDILLVTSERNEFDSSENHNKSHFLPILAYDQCRELFRKKFIKQPSTYWKSSADTLIEKFQPVVEKN